MKWISFVLIIAIALTSCETPLKESDKIASLIKVWGFLKYYHPKVAAGDFDWDEQFFAMLPQEKKASNKVELSDLYSNWIDTLGAIEPCISCQQKGDASVFSANFDLEWLDNSELFSERLSKQLRHIEANRHQGKKHYISTIPFAGNFNLTNEKPYDYHWEDENLRLLTLARYWNIIEYFFPYKYQTDTSWAEVLNQLVLKFQNPDTERDFHLAMLELVVNTDDSHASLITDVIIAYFGNLWIPAKFKIIENKAIIKDFYAKSLAERDDLRIGDVVTKVDGKSVQTLYEEKEKFISGSNQAVKKSNAFRAIFNGDTEKVTIEYQRDHTTSTKEVSRYTSDYFINSPKISNEKMRLLEDNIGYVNMGILEIADVPEVMETFLNTKAIIFDIRNYPKGTANAILSYISSKSHVFYKKVIPDLNYPGKFLWKDGDPYRIDKDRGYDGKVILLVNEKTQSHAEFTTMCLQTGDNVVTIGSQTSGADGNVSKVDLVGGFETYITGMGIF